KDYLKLIKEIGLQETGILTSVSDYHIFLKLEKNRNQAMKDYLMIVNTAIELGITPRCHFEDLTRADIYGFCVPFAIELMKIRENTGVNIKIRLCDTMGYGITYPGASLPRSVDKLVRAMIDDAGVPGELLEWHGHNDFHKVLINATTAWLYGCAGANGTLLGFGERTGNPPIEGLVMEYIGLNGDLNGIDTTVITQIARYFEKELGTHISKNYPFVGEDFNATSAGIHADGALKNEEVYNIFNTNKILKRPLGVIVNDKSGAAGIAYWINAHLGLEGEMRIDKRHPGISRIHKWVIQQYEAGRVTGISHNEIEKQARKHIPELFYSDFDRIKRKAYEISAHLLEDLIELDEIRSMNPELQESILKRFMEEDPFMQFIYITDLEGRKITKNITQIVDRAKYENFGLNEDFSNRSWFIEPLKNGKVHVTNLYTSKITSALCITVSGPIRNEEEEIVGILGMDLKFEDLARMVEEEDGD
ncbi:MAG: histone-lysine N-methyltransferase, partial [Thermodesulfobacteriota bacterium]|nr:histone-lysine N-methyltransferase [Thermodesulfobacteriota bacterium]